MEAAMLAMSPRRRALRKTLREMPTITIRALAWEVGYSHVALMKARDGVFEPSEEMVLATSAALRKWADTCQRLAAMLEDATRGNHD